MNPIVEKKKEEGCKKYLSNDIIKPLTQKCMMMIFFEKYIRNQN
jgi:hypothetical protein